jgi:hypothetical protein
MAMNKVKEGLISKLEMQFLEQEIMIALSGLLI